MMKIVRATIVQLHRTLYISVDKPPLRQYSESAFEILCILCYRKDKDHNTYTFILNRKKMSSIKEPDGLEYLV